MADSRDDLLLIPGLLNDEELWRDQIFALSDLAACTVADITLAETIEAMAAHVLKLAPASFSLAGFSLGGFVAQEVLRQAPERVTRLALLDTSCRADTPERIASRRKTNDMVRMPGRFTGMGERMLESYLHPEHLRDATKVGRVKSMTSRLGPEVLIRQNAVARKCGKDVLASFEGPCLILCGEQDRITSLREHEEMACIIPQAEFVIVSKAGHMTPIEQPESVNLALRRWLMA